MGSQKTREQEPVRQNGPAKPQAGVGKDKDDACRCKETSQMTPRQLLGLMMRDLAFWKKPKKE